MSLPDLAGIDWEAAPRDQAASLRRAVLGGEPIQGLIAVVSGKGGVGKTNVVANLAVAAAGLGARVLVVDGDVGLSNLDVLMGLCPERSVVDVMKRRCSFADALVRGPKGIHLLPAGSGRNDLRVFEAGGTARLVSLLATHGKEYDLILLDVGAGIGQVVVDLAARASRVLLVAMPEPTSFADAYATCKTLWAATPSLEIETLINCVNGPAEGRRVHEHLERMCARFLEESLGSFGVLDRDPRLLDAVSDQRLVIEAFPNARVSKQLAALAQGLVQHCRHRGSEVLDSDSPLCVRDKGGV